MAHFLPPELVRQVNELEWPNVFYLFCSTCVSNMLCFIGCILLNIKCMKFNAIVLLLNIKCMKFNMFHCQTSVLYVLHLCLNVLSMCSIFQHVFYMLCAYFICSRFRTYGMCFAYIPMLNICSVCVPYATMYNMCSECVLYVPMLNMCSVCFPYVCMLKLVCFS